MERFKKSKTVKLSGAAVIMITMFCYNFGKDIYKIGVKDGKATKQIEAKQHPVKK